MRLSDALSGLAILTFGLAIAGYSSTFPPMPGQAVGPSLFPMAIGIGMAAVGAVLCVVAVLRGNLWSCITAHAAIDAFGLLMLRLLKPMLQEVLKAAGSAADAGMP